MCTGFFYGFMKRFDPQAVLRDRPRDACLSYCHQIKNNFFPGILGQPRVDWVMKIKTRLAMLHYTFFWTTFEQLYLLRNLELMSNAHSAFHENMSIEENLYWIHQSNGAQQSEWISFWKNQKMTPNVLSISYLKMYLQGWKRLGAFGRPTSLDYWSKTTAG